MNTTNASIGARRKVTTTPLWQYDYGQKLIIKGVQLPESYEVLFGTTGELVTVLGDENGVNIPDALLQEGTDITAYLFLHTGQNDGEVEYVMTIPIKERPKTSDVTPDPVEQSIIEQAIAILTTVQTATIGYMNETKGYRDEAEGYMQRAEQSATVLEKNNFFIDENGHLIVEVI